MPSVKNDTTPAEGAMDVTTRVASGVAATMGVAGNALPKQHEAQVEQEWT
jgi:hypothetical protein